MPILPMQQALERAARQVGGRRRVYCVARLQTIVAGPALVYREHLAAMPAYAEDHSMQPPLVPEASNERFQIGIVPHRAGLLLGARQDAAYCRLAMES